MVADVGFNKLRGKTFFSQGDKAITPLDELKARKKQNVRLFSREQKADRLMRDRYGVKNVPYSADQKVREKIRAGLNNQLMIDPSAGSATRKVNTKTENIAKAFAKLDQYIEGTGDEFENGIVLGANDELMKALREGGYDYLADQVEEYSKEFKSAKHYDHGTYARAMLDISEFQQKIRDRIDVDWIYSQALDSPDLDPAAPTPVDGVGNAPPGTMFTRDSNGNIVIARKNSDGEWVSPELPWG